MLHYDLVSHVAPNPTFYMKVFPGKHVAAKGEGGLAGRRSSGFMVAGRSKSRWDSPALSKATLGSALVALIAANLPPAILAKSSSTSLVSSRCCLLLDGCSMS